MEEQQEPNGMVAMNAFLEWVQKQGAEFARQVLYHIDVITLVLNNRLLVDTPAFTAPDVWSMAHSAATLRDIAAASGFSEAAQYCEETRQFASEMITTIEVTVQGVSGLQA